MTKKVFFRKELFTIDSSVGKVTLFSLAIPMLFELMMNNLQGTVNTAVLTAYSDNAVGAVGAVNPLISMLLLATSVISLGATVVISNYLGAENIGRAREISFAGIFTSVAITLFMTPLLFLLGPFLMRFLNLTGEIYSFALTYFYIRAAFIVTQGITTALFSILRCYGYSRHTFYVGMIVNGLNLLLNVIVIYFPDYSPVHGVEGVALSAGIANLIGAICATLILFGLKIRIKLPGSFAKMFSDILSVLKIGLPSAISSASFTIAQVVTTSFVALIGDWALSAKVYYSNILAYLYLFSASMGSANAILVGRRFGAGELALADEMNKNLTRLTCLVNLVVSLLVVIFYRPLMGIFTKEEDVISLALIVFVVDIVAEQGRAVSQVYEYALRGVGDVWFSLIILTVSCWVVSIGLAYVLAIPCGLGLVGCFIAVSFDEAIRGVVTYLRWKGGRWKSENQKSV